MQGVLSTGPTTSSFIKLADINTQGKNNEDLPFLYFLSNVYFRHTQFYQQSCI